MYATVPAWVTRAWWVLRWAGLTARVLDGGLAAWEEAGGPVSDVPDAPAAVPETLRLAAGGAPEIDLEVLRAILGRIRLIDARDPAAFAAGHIPGAINVPSPVFWDVAGKLRSPEDLRSILAGAGVNPGEEVITYCGGGVLATYAALAWLVAADGANSIVRRKFGSGEVLGPDFHQQIVTEFYADLEKYVGDKPYFHMFISHPDYAGWFGAQQPRTGLHRYNFANPDRRPYTQDEIIARIRGAIGDPDIDIQVVRSVQYRYSTAITRDWRVGRIFLPATAHTATRSGAAMGPIWACRRRTISAGNWRLWCVGRPGRPCLTPTWRSVAGAPFT